MSSNTNTELTTLDFADIKSNFITYLRSQDTLKDYDYTGSALSTLLDIFAYNTQYNAFYLNMVGNEMFLDSAVQRGSVVSKAKMLDYVPRSAIAPTATINMNVVSVGTTTLTLPQYTKFMSGAIDGTNYIFLTTQQQTVPVSSNTAVFTDIELKQAQQGNYSFTVDITSNPTLTFEIPDPNIDTSTLQVIVQQSSSNSAYNTYNLATSKLELNGSSMVFFIQEGINGNYEIYFGDDVLGKKLSDGNIIIVSFLTTEGSAAAGANTFTLMDTIGGFGSATIYPQTPATQGGTKESIQSIKFQAPKSYAAQNRAVSKNDYITIIQENNLGIPFDSVNVWGGEENDPPVFGQVFISMKPSGSYNLTQAQKQRIIEEIIKPVSVMSVTPAIIDPDYTYVKLGVNVYYDPTKTSLTADQIKSGVSSAITIFGNNTLNTFNSTFNAFGLLEAIQNFNGSIITSEFDLQLQKKFKPNLTSPTTIKLYYNCPLQRGMFLSGVNSSPGMQFRNPTNLALTVDDVYIEEIPTSTNGVESLTINNPGFGYQSAPNISILGDGTGAAAYCTLSSTGAISNVIVTSTGSGYTSALAVVTPQSNDTTGKLGALGVTLQGRYGNLRSYYNINGVKTVFNSTLGSIDYKSGIITLDSFNPLDVKNDFGQLSVTVRPTTTILSSSFNGILSIDPYDNTAITINVIAKTS